MNTQKSTIVPLFACMPRDVARFVYVRQSKHTALRIGMTTTTSNSCERFIVAMMGTWAGSGKGEYPTMESFQYETEETVSRVPVQTKGNFFHTSLASWPPGMGHQKAMHFENGFLRCQEDGSLEWNLTHNFGATEVVKGKVEDRGSALKATLQSTDIGNVSHLTGTRREITIDGMAGQMTDQFFMSTKEVPKMTLHLTTNYRKVGGR